MSVVAGTVVDTEEGRGSGGAVADTAGAAACVVMAAVVIGSAGADNYQGKIVPVAGIGHGIHLEVHSMLEKTTVVSAVIV